MPPMVNDVSMTDETFADYSDTVKMLQGKGLSYAEAVNKIIADGIKAQAKKLAEWRAAAQAKGEVTGG